MTTQLIFPKTSFLHGLLFIIIFYCSSLYSQKPVVFKHLTVENGLSQGSVLSITQDRKGFLWFGTMDGLNRYDGNQIKIYKSFYRNNPIGSSIKITVLMADKQENVWIGTNNGLYVYNIPSDSFRVFYHAESDKKSLSHNIIKTLFQDTKGNVWVGTENGLNKLSPTNPFVFQHQPLVNIKTGIEYNEVLSVYENREKKILAGTTKGLFIISNEKTNAVQNAALYGSLPGISISSIAEDQQGNLWVGSDVSGLYKVSKDFKTVKQYIHGGGTGPSLVSNIIRKIIADRKGRIWVGTLKGLSIYDPENDNFDSYIQNVEDPQSLNFNSIYNVYEDNQGIIWIGTFFGGVNIVEPTSTKFTVYQNDNTKNSISSNVISAIVGDENDNLWIGTEAEGINYFDRKKQEFKWFKNKENKDATLASNLIKSILIDKEKRIWVGKHFGGLDLLDSKGKIIKQFGNPSTDNTLKSDDITNLMEDHFGRIWIGNEDKGINIFSENGFEKFETVFPEQQLTSKAITFLFEDSRNNIWIGTKHGLNLLQFAVDKVIKFSKKDYPDQLGSDFINCITEDMNGIIWIGTYSGISFYDPSAQTLQTISIADGMNGYKVVGILTDNKNNLWISTNKGLHQLDFSRKDLNSYNTYDGLPGDIFNYNSFYKDKQGHLFFGSYKGLIEFSPKDIETNMTPPPVVLTGLSINNTPININEHPKIISTNITAAKTIKLHYNQNLIDVNYAVLNFIKPGKNRSAYKLEGYDKDWIYTSTFTASYTNLPPAEYNLLIKGSNNDGIWSKEVYSLKIIISPPFWKTWWAYLIYLLIFFSILYGAFYFFNSRAELERKLRFEHMENVKQAELHQMKMDFFTHISHEIRTPLTLITGPVEKLLSMNVTKSLSQKLLLSIKNNADRLLKLINDLMDFRKADSGYTQLKISYNDIVKFSKTVFSKFKEAALSKSINFIFKSDEKALDVYFDMDHLEIVLSNLLSNAVKFTEKGGQISMFIKKESPDLVTINVCDNGIGIPKEEQDRIFTGYYQVDAKGNIKAGTGIGLAFSKSLVELHKGSLTFCSEIGSQTVMNKTCFTVSLKLGKNHLTQVGIIAD